MTRKKNSTWFICMTMVVSIALIALIGCDSKSVLDDVPAGTTSVSVSSSPASITENTTSIIEATVISNSVGLANQSVTFAVSPASAGYFTPAVGTTDSSGVVATVFTGISVGTATITCTVGGGATSGTTAMSVTTSTQSGTGGNVGISASPTVIFAGGTDTSVVTIVVRDANGQPAPDSTLVKLTAGEQFIDIDGNGYWSAGDSLLVDANNNGIWDAIGAISPIPAFTSGGTGQVTVNYISGSEPTSVFIKATVDENGISGTIETPILLTPDATIASIYMNSDSVSLVIKGTGGIETSVLFATGYDYLGNPVPEGLPIIFSIIDNPYNPLFPGNDSAHLADVLPHETFTAYTNSQGVAQCAISSGHYSGTVRIRAKNGPALSEATQLLIASGPPVNIWVGIGAEDDCNVPYWNIVNERVDVVAVVSDYMHNPVNDSTVVYFTTDESTVKSHEARTQDGDGTASTEWISGQTSAPADGIVWVIAETAGGTVKDSAWIFSSGITAGVTNSGASDTISVFADGDSKFLITFLGTDVNGNPVDDGTPYKMYSTYLDVSDDLFEGVCGAAVAEVEVTSMTLKADYSMTGGSDDGIGAVDFLNLSSFGGSSGYTILLQTGIANKSMSTGNADPSTVRLSGYTDIDVFIADRWGNPLGDHTLNMTSSTGTVTGATQNTNMYGEATGFRWTAPADSASIGDHVVTITDTDARGNNLVLNVKVTVE